MEQSEPPPPVHPDTLPPAAGALPPPVKELARRSGKRFETPLGALRAPGLLGRS